MLNPKPFRLSLTQSYDANQSVNKASYISDLITASQLLRAGSVVAMPTETVYGLAADISQQAAVEQIFALKGRPTNHPLIIHIGAITQLQDYAMRISDYAYQLAKHFWPGPLTLVLYKSDLVGDWVTGGHDTVGIRMPNHPLALELINQVGKPLAAPSANRFGKISPTQAAHVYAEFGDKVAIVEGGDCQVGIESTIIDATEPHVCTILRPGMISEAQIQAVIGSHVGIQPFSKNSRQVSGTLKSHYAPSKPTFLFQDAQGLAKLQAEQQGRFVGLLLSEDYAGVFTQSITMPNSENDYAQTLYSAMRSADMSLCDKIAIELPPMGWKGIRDRLHRSCASFQQEIYDNA